MSKERKMVSMKWFVISICLLLAFAIAFTVVFIDSGYANKALVKLGLRKNNYQKNGVSAKDWDRCLKNMGIDADVVMFGDSITAYGDFSKYFPNITICNLGVPDDTLIDLTERAYMLGTVKPEKVFILAGINGLSNFNVETTYNEYEEMLTAVRVNTDAEIYIISILPVSKEKEARIVCSNKTIIQFNNRLVKLAEERGFTYIDLNTEYLQDGAMNPAYTKDGIHLTDAAYDIWAQTISKWMLK